MTTERRVELREDKETRFEIKLAPDERLNVAYSPNFTLGDEIHESFLRELVAQTEKGGRATCWRCNNAAVRFDLVTTALGLFAVSSCESCHTWGLY